MKFFPVYSFDVFFNLTWDAHHLFADIVYFASISNIRSQKEPEILNSEFDINSDLGKHLLLNEFENVKSILVKIVFVSEIGD
jgi:hypothetical protein